MIRAVIIDDEQNNIDNLEVLLSKHCPQVSLAGQACNALEGAALIRKISPDLVFLDIQMPGGNGFDLLKSLDQTDFGIIFVTAHDQYGIQAVKFSAIDYLLKPVAVEDLKAAVQKAAGKAAQKNQNLQLQNLLQLLRQEQEKSSHRIALQSTRETRFIETGKILRCESSNNYTTFHLAGGEKIVTSRPIFEYEEMLAGYDFFRCHQSHLVNKKHIRSWVKEDGGYLLMDDNSEVPVSRNKREALKLLFVQK
ncbi:response regulator transcription factor [Flavisolibacter sp. BT320]|nr:response regulator transcription factor [Flavisolibacter longurius]